MKKTLRTSSPQKGSRAQAHAAQLRFMTDRKNSSPRASLAFSALAGAYWLRGLVGKVIAKIKITIGGREKPECIKERPELYILKSTIHFCAAVLVLSFCCIAAQAQQSAASTSVASVPRLVNFSGNVADAEGKPARSITGVTFAIYKDQEGGAALWLETQNVQPDDTGRYTVQLGATKPDGLPLDLFSAGEARWLGVQVSGQAEQPRVILLSVPYALKAADSETLGGLPASAFMLAAPPANSRTPTLETPPSPASAEFPASTVTGSGTAGYLPLWTGTTIIGNSLLFQSGSGTTAKLGINTPKPVTTLDANGAATIRGLLSLPATSSATATTGYNSQPVGLSASAFNSSTSAAVAQNFLWQAEAIKNNSTSPSGTLSLLFGQGTATPIETGFKIGGDGKVIFASGQTFPGTGSVASVGLSAPSSDFLVSGSPVTGTGTLALNWNVAPSSANTANAIVKRDASGSFTATSIVGQTGVNYGASGVSGTATATGQGNSYGVIGSSASDSGSGVFGFASGSAGMGIGGWSMGNSGAGLYGLNTSQNGAGVSAQGGNNGAGIVASGGAYGVFAKGGDYGVYTSGASTGVSSIGTTMALYAETTQGGGTALYAINDDPGDNEAIYASSRSSEGLFAVTTSNAAAAGYFVNSGANAGAPVLETVGAAICEIDRSANLYCGGSKSAVVPVDNGSRKVALYAMESPENWFEDFGSGSLTGGKAVVSLDSAFAQTVNSETEYHVFLTPKGDCNGLYVANETVTGFEVRELGEGHSAVAFDFRIVARRKGFESIRLADMTERFHELEVRAARVRTKKTPLRSSTK